MVTSHILLTSQRILQDSFEGIVDGQVDDKLGRQQQGKDWADLSFASSYRVVEGRLK